MLLLPQTIVVSTNPMVKNHYKSLGYDIENTYIEVNVLDLPKNSDKRVLVKCDYCKKEYTMVYKKYISSRKIIDKNACKECKKHKDQDIWDLRNKDKIKPLKTNKILINKNEKQQKSKRKITYQRVIDACNLNDYILVGSKDDKYNSTVPISFICKHHTNQGIQKNYLTRIENKTACFYCGIEKRSGKNGGNWKGGISPISQYLRLHINDWVKDSRALYNYKCVLTGSSKNQVHHVYKNFSDIVAETLSILNLELYDSISMYSENELEDMRKICLELHYKYGLGIPIENSLHKLFHIKYGKTNNTDEQFFEFCKEYFDYNELKEDVI